MNANEFGVTNSIVNGVEEGRRMWKFVSYPFCIIMLYIGTSIFFISYV